MSCRLLSNRIRFYEEIYSHKVYGEVFITNKHGANIAQTGKTSDYRQDDEEWWQSAKNDGFYVKRIFHMMRVQVSILWTSGYGLMMRQEDLPGHETCPEH